MAPVQSLTFALLIHMFDLPATDAQQQVAVRQQVVRGLGRLSAIPDDVMRFVRDSVVRPRLFACLRCLLSAMFV